MNKFIRKLGVFLVFLTIHLGLVALVEGGLASLGASTKKTSGTAEGKESNGVEQEQGLPVVSIVATLALNLVTSLASVYGVDQRLVEVVWWESVP